MPTWKELRRFSKRDGWTLYKDTDHYFYLKVDEEGNILTTKVPKGTGEILKAFFIQILKKTASCIKRILQQQDLRLFSRANPCCN